MKNNYTVYMHISPSNKRYVGITSTMIENVGKMGKDISIMNILLMQSINMVGIIFNILLLQKVYQKNKQKKWK